MSIYTAPFTDQGQYTGASLSPEILAALQQQQWGLGNNAYSNGGQTYAPVFDNGLQKSGEDSLGYAPSLTGYSSMANGAGPGGNYTTYDLSGNGGYSHPILNGGSFNTGDFRDLQQAALTMLSMYGIGAGLGAAGAGSAGGIGGSGIGAAEGGTALGGSAIDPALAAQGNSINALDAATGVPYGSEASGWTMGGAATGAGGAVGAGGAAAGGAASGAGGVGSAASSLLNGPYGKLLSAGLMGLGGVAAGSRNGTPPTPPDPTTTAQAQLNANIQAANYSAGLNRVNQSTPWGSLTYSQVPGQNGGPPQWQANVALAPAQQQLLDQSNQLAISRGQTANSLMNGSSSEFSSPVGFGGSPALATGANYGSIQNGLNTSNVPGLVGGNQLASDLNTTRNALYQQQAAYLDPQWSNQMHDMQAQLTNQGVMQNSDAWNRAMDDLNRQRTFAYQQASDSAIANGGQEQSRLFNIGLASNQNAFNQDLSSGNFANAAQAQGFSQSLQNANLQNAARQQSVNEILAQRNQTLNEINQFSQGSQPTTPQFGNVPQANVSAPDIATLMQQYFANQMGGYNSGVSQNNAVMNGLFGLGSAFLSGGSK
jgi:hypothetical protein